MIGQTISHYKILEKLGEGGMGVVYKARDTKLDRVVALKFLPPTLLSSESEVSRFEQEAKAISALNDPRIATIHDILDVEGERFLVLEYLPGGTLKTKLNILMEAGHEFSPDEVIDFGVQLAEGLAHAHRKGIIHRDIKTDNIMLTEDGKLKITDFGLAKLKGGVHITRSGSTVGTAAYMSPEQIRAGEIDNRSDLFSAGVVLYELVTGRLPFRGEHEASLAYSIANEDPIPPKTLRPSMPSALDHVIRRCLEKDPEKRFKSADELATELRLIRQADAKRTGPPERKRKLFWIASGIVAALVVVGVFLVVRSGTGQIDRKSIAVLPFTNLSGSKDDEYFSDGVTEDIITQLSKIGDLRVISPASVVQYKGVKKSSREIGKELNVSTVLEGSVRQAGDHVHITAHLIDAATDEHLWAESYDEEMTQIFKIQSDVAQKIANALQAKLSPAEKERIQKKPTESIDAYAKYLEGREYYSRYHKQDNDNAIRLFKEALVSDQNYALAYAGLGDAYGQGVQKFGFPSQWVDSSVSMSYKAISIDPNLTEGYKSLALGFAMKGWLHKALETLQKAIQINPNFDPAVENIGWSYWLVGRFDEAHLWMEKSRTLNPSFTYSHFAKGTVYLSLYEFDKAKQCFEKALEIQPDFTYSHVGQALMYLLQNDFGRASHEAQLILSHSSDDLLGLNLSGNIALITGDGANARKYYEKAESIAPGSDVFFLSTRHSTRLGYALLKNGELKAAAKMFAESDLRDQKGIEVGDESFAIPYDRACMAAVNGKKEAATEWLQKAFDQGWRDYRFGLMDPLLENLRDDPQFKELIEKTKMAVDQMRAEVDAREKSGK